MKIRILATSDIHGYITPFRYSDLKMCEQGFAKCLSTMNKYRNDNTLLIDNGDILEGSPLLNYFYRNHKGEKNPMSNCLNIARYDYFNVGNHDFNYGQENLLDYIKHNDAQCLLGNVKLNGEYIGAQYRIHSFDNKHKIAIIGVVTHYFVNWEKKDNLLGLEITNAFDYVKDTVAYIKENEDVQGIVVVYHGGFEKDIETGKATEKLTGENEAYRMCEEIDGIDILITGHQHRSIAGKCHNTYVTQTAFNAKEFALIDWDMDNGHIENRLISSSEEADEQVMSVFKTLEADTQRWLDIPMGEVMDADLEVKDEFDARVHKHPVISFINKVQMHYAKSDLSGNALFNGAVGFRKNITTRDIVSTYVYPNTTIVYEITGKILKEYLEKSAEYFDIKDGKIVVSHSFAYPKPQHYNYDMVDGVDYTIKVSNPIGNRIIELKRDGVDVKDNDIFTIALSNYRASGGGNYFMFEGCKVVKDIQDDMVTLISNYLVENPKLYVGHKDNVKVIL